MREFRKEKRAGTVGETIGTTGISEPEFDSSKCQNFSYKANFPLITRNFHVQSFNHISGTLQSRLHPGVAGGYAELRTAHRTGIK